MADNKKASKKTKNTKKTIPQDENLDEIQKLAKLITSEAELEKKNEELERIKKSAKEKQRIISNRNIAEGKTSLERDEVLSPKELEALGIKEQKVVQKVKLYEWTAPIRIAFPFEPRTFMILVAAFLAFILYLAILGHYGLMFALGALLFFIYVAGTTKPEDTTHMITSQGIDTFDNLYEWYMLNDFWYTEKNDQIMLVVDTKLRSPGRLTLLLKKDEMATIFMLLQDKLLYKEIKKPGSMYKLSYGRYIPIEEIRL
jgi:hypothetical protein